MLFYFFFNDTATTEIYTLSLHDALPISFGARGGPGKSGYFSLSTAPGAAGGEGEHPDIRLARETALWIAQQKPKEKPLDRESTRLNSRHANISYAVFCLEKKKYKSHSSD